jgi:nucleoside-diphosphate-sugar epimerase
MKKKKVLITGASGAVGSELVHQLVQFSDLFTITLFDQNTPNSTRFLRRFERLTRIVYGDITNKDDLIEVCQKQDFIIHLAAIIPPVADEFPDLAYSVNVEGTENIVHAVEQGSPDAFLIFASSISVYGDRVENPWIKVGDPLIPSEGDAYALTKIKAESCITNSSLDWTIFRLTAIMGKHKLTELFFHMPLDTLLEIATSRDTACAFVKALYHKDELSGRIFNLGGGPTCRIKYRDFLTKSFTIAGLGKLDFPSKSFAEKNFHCGYYEDGHILEEILHFRKESLLDYFKFMTHKIHPLKRTITKLLKGIIKKKLLNQSLPYKAFQSRDARLIDRFFRNI